MNKSVAYILLILAMLFWATNFHVVKIALESYSAMTVAALRFFFGLATLAIIAYYKFGNSLLSIRFSRKEWWFLFLTSFFGIFLTIYCFNKGLGTTSAINGSLIISTSPAITAILSYFISKVKSNTLQLLAIFLSFIGVTIILIKGDISRLAQLQFEIGDLFILMMAIVFSISQIIVSKYLAHIDAIILTLITTLIALILFGFFSVPELISTSIPTDWRFWSSILFMGIMSTGIAYTAFYYCVVALGATTSSLYMNVIPLFTVLLAFPFGEKIEAIQLIGGAIVIIGLLLFNYSKRRTVAQVQQKLESV